MIRHLEVARDTAVKARTHAMLALKAGIITTPADLPEKVEAIAGKVALIRHLVALRSRAMTLAKPSLRALVRRWPSLDAEIMTHDAHLKALVERCAPTMVKTYDIKVSPALNLTVLDAAIVTAAPVCGFRP